MELIILPIHLLVLLFCIVTIIRSDTLGFAWIRGKVEMLEYDKVVSLHKQMWIGLLLMIVSGSVLFYASRELLLSSNEFYFKILSVTVLVINAFVIGKLMKISTTKKFVDTTKSEKTKLYISGAISIIFWITTIVLAFFIIPEGGSTKDAVLPIVSNPSITKEFSMEEIRVANTEASCLTAINGNVYDVTKYIPIHPGGKSNIMKVCGGDGTAIFTKKHGGDEKPNLILRSFQVGILK